MSRILYAVHRNTFAHTYPLLWLYSDLSLKGVDSPFVFVLWRSPQCLMIAAPVLTGAKRPLDFPGFLVEYAILR